MKRHKVHSCKTCPKSYPHAKSLREHQETKHQGKRYRCDVDGCNDIIAQKKNLARHKAAMHRVAKLSTPT
jgi:uncharacterized Zn-finger protein